MSKKNPTYADMVTEWLEKFSTRTFIVDRKYDRPAIFKAVNALNNAGHAASFYVEQRDGRWCIVAKRHYEVETAI